MALFHVLLLGLFARSALTQATTLDCSPSSPHGLQAGCWAQLGVSDYIKNWLAANGTAAHCPTLGFAQCFLEYNGFGGRTCNLLTRGTCDAFETAGAEASYYSPQQFYTLWNIYAIYQYFNQFSEALSNGAATAGTTIGDIVSTVSPDPKAGCNTALIWTIVSGGFWMIAALGLGTVVGLVGTGLAVVTGMNAFFLPTHQDTTAARFILLGDMGSELVKLVEQYQADLEQSLKLLQNNSTLFLAAAAPGGFSTREVTSLNTASANLFHELQLFVLSQALSANGIVVAKSAGVRAPDVAARTGALRCPSLSPAGVCAPFWVDAAAGDSYALHSTVDWHFDDKAPAVLDKIVASHWATLPELFKVPPACAGKHPGFDGAKVSCLATHRTCEWNYDPQPLKGQTTRLKQWTNCDDDATWGTECSSWETRVLIPASYLGPLLEQKKLYCRKL